MEWVYVQKSLTKLGAIRVKINDEDKELILIRLLPSSCEHVKPILMYGKETMNFAKVTIKLI